jgi:hypothetical protein
VTTTLTPGLVVDVVREIDGFRKLEHEWRDLYEASPAATPFQTWEWLFTWWEVYGTPRALRLITARHDGRLVGVMPLMATKPGHLQFVGTGLSDHLDVLIDSAHTEDVLSAWIEYLQRSARLELIDLHEVRPAAVVWQFYGRWPGHTGHYQQSTCAELDIAPLEELLVRWSKNTRRSARTAMNRIDKGGYTEHWARPDEIGDMAEQLVRDHQQMWEERGGITPAHAEPAFVRFVRTVCERTAVREEIALVRLEPPEGLADPMRLAELLVVGRQYVGGWLSAENETARNRMSIAVIENVHGIQLANRRGIGVMSMLRGLEPGKLRMHDRTKANHRLLLAGHGPRAIASWTATAVPAAAIAKLKEWEKHNGTAQRVTTLLRSVRDRVRA